MCSHFLIFIASYLCFFSVKRAKEKAVKLVINNIGNINENRFTGKFNPFRKIIIG